MKYLRYVVAFASLALSANSFAANQCSGSVLNGSTNCYLLNSQGVNNTQIRAWQTGNWQAGGGWANYYASVWNPAFLVIWDNNDTSSKHKEFDVSFSRSVYSGGGTLGYGTRTLRDLYNNEWSLDTTMTARGKWQSQPQRYGKSHTYK